MSEPVDLDARRSARSTTPDGGENLACPKCGGEWWKSPGIVLEADTMNPTGFALPLTCVECEYVYY